MLNEKDLYALSSYQYALPEELIAQIPCDPRDSSRLMVIHKDSGNITEMVFRDLAGFLERGDGLIFNDSRVIPSRLIGRRNRMGSKTEVFLTRRHADSTWSALVRPGKKLPPGSSVEFNENLSCKVMEVLANGERRIQFHCQGNLEQLLEQCGQVPLPHYIRRQADADDVSRYQTVYAANPGSVAAPTAGLHFTEDLLRQFTEKGVSQTRLTLHVGVGTFRPVRTDDIRAHLMHPERCIISPEAAQTINEAAASNKRQICVGTTCCRMLETAAAEASVAKGSVIRPGEYDTDIFIYPGYSFRYVKNLLTNFHLPGSTLLMLVCAFAGYELMMEAYAKAVRDRYRFFSYGDAMLII